MKPGKTKSFDAVAESRRWKEAVSAETRGMTRDQVLEYFNKERVMAALRGAESSAAVVREDPPAQ